nr:hypothetical protein [Pedobacter panaciterrae]
MQLLPSQLNEIYDVIIKTKYFSPSQFTKSATGDEFRMEGTGYYFRIFEDTGYVNSLIVNFSPGEFLYKEGSVSMPWIEVPLYFKKWLTYLKREISAPDKWGRLFDEMRYLIGTTQNEYANFSHVEYLDISSKIEHIKASLSQIPLLQEQNVAIINQLDNLLELTNKLNKFDWQNLFIGTIITIIIQLNVTQDNAALLYDLIKSTFKGLFLK